MMRMRRMRRAKMIMIKAKLKMNVLVKGARMVRMMM